MKTSESTGYPVDTRVVRLFCMASNTELTTAGRCTLPLEGGGELRAEIGQVSRSFLAVADLEEAGFLSLIHI
eukprot:1435392-Prorocentrum_lima.AAC.1